MKKAILILAVLGLSLPGMSQEKYVVSAGVALNSNNLDEAKENIDKAMQSADTKEKPKALFMKGEVYVQMQGIEKYKKDNPYREAAQALLKLVEVKPDHEKDNVDQMLIFCANYYYNDGFKAYNDKKYGEATECMNNVVKIHDLGGGKRFEKYARIKSFDTIAAQAALLVANAAYLQGKYDEAIPLFIKVVNNPISQSPNAFACLIDAYNKQKDTKNAYATIEQGRKIFPNDPMLRNNELNYFISQGKQDELVKKLEDAAASEPNNADIQFNLATTYLNMANPKEGPKPANYEELNKKSETAFQNGLKLAPDNMVFNYNFGAFYFNQAKEINDQMNATPDNEIKKYNDLKAKRDDLFNKALPYLEKAYTIGQPNETILKGEDLNSYKTTLLALKNIYAAQSKNDKAVEMNKKLESLH
jgi:Tfp pilus assembly protein PilF